MGNGKILLLIPAYRDLELRNTIKSALKNAEESDKLCFAILNQYGPETGDILDQFRKSDKRFRIAEVPWRETQGIGWARHLLEEFYRDEEFALQLDAHMIFGKGWDTILKENMNWCQDMKGVISSYPVKYEFDKDGNTVIETTERVRVELHPGKGRFDFESGVIKVSEDDNVPKRTLYATGGLEFYRGEMLKEVRYNTEITFTGEEAVRSAQLFTFGYNVYAPIGVPIYHHYGRFNRHKFWQDMYDDVKLRAYYDEITKRSDVAVDRIMSGNIKGFEQYFGKEKSIEEFLDLYWKDLAKNR